MNTKAQQAKEIEDLLKSSGQIALEAIFVRLQFMIIKTETWKVEVPKDVLDNMDKISELFNNMSIRFPQLSEQLKAWHSSTPDDQLPIRPSEEASPGETSLNE